MQKTELEIESVLNELFARYRIAEGLINDLDKAVTSSTKTALTREISTVFAKIKRNEIEITKHRIDCESRGKDISDTNKQIVSEIVKLVTKLIPILGEIEARVQAERSNLAPQIHEGVKAMQMVSAYSNNS